jgi:hypothetical protein
MARKARREVDQAEYQASLERAEQALQEQRDRWKPAELGYHRSFAGTRYLGGHSKFSEGGGGVLFFTTESIGLGKTPYTGPLEAVIPMETVASIQITGQQVAKSKVGPVLLFGLFGLAAKGSTHTTTVVIRTNDDEIAYFSIADSIPDAVKASLSRHSSRHITFRSMKTPRRPLDCPLHRLRTSPTKSGSSQR